MPNAIDLCLAADVAGDLNVSSDATVARCVTAASRIIAAHCNRAFEREAGIVEYPVGTHRPFLLLERAPIVSVESINEFGTPLDASVYTIEGDLANAGMVYRKYSIPWPRTAYVGGFTSETLDTYQGRSDVLAVTYTAGFVTPGQNAIDPTTYPAVTLPEDVQEAAIQTAVQLYRTRGVDERVASEAIGDWSVSYFNKRVEGSPSPIPGVALAILAPYVRQRAN